MRFTGTSCKMAKEGRGWRGVQAETTTCVQALRTEESGNQRQFCTVEESASAVVGEDVKRQQITWG